jgi:putative spermidine/putrescine transport system substrate-binding protein
MTRKLTRRSFLMLGSTVVGGMLLAPYAAFAQDATATAEATPAPLNLPPAPAAGPIDLTAAGGMDALVAAATKEGEISTTALPDDWANYGEIKKAFLAKYPLKHNDNTPDGSSSDEVGQITANAGNALPGNPDVIDVGFSWGKTATDEKLLQPYKVATWDTIPDALKDADGYWYGDYYGTMVFEVNSDIVTNVPQDWNDLLKPEYKGQIALSGDPAAAAQGTNTIWAAAYGLNGNKLDDASAGIEFFQKLIASGNLIPAKATPATVAKGETPITMRWDYNAIANRDANKDTVTIEVVYPKSGTVAGVYVQAINAYAPHPNAARLWMEYLYSDEGQILFLKSGARPVRFDDLVARKVIPDEIMASLPASDVPVGVPTADQINTVQADIKAKWTALGVTFAQ